MHYCYFPSVTDFHILSSAVVNTTGFINLIGALTINNCSAANRYTYTCLLIYTVEITTFLSFTYSCTECLQSNNACGWCSYSKQCTQTQDACLIRNDINEARWLQVSVCILQDIITIYF